MNKYNRTQILDNRLKTLKIENKKMEEKVLCLWSELKMKLSVEICFISEYLCANVLCLRKKEAS